MIKAAVCDDEKEIIVEMKTYLKEYYDNQCIVHTFIRGSEMLESDETYDIMFLDIDIGDMNGIHLAEKIREKNTQSKIVFVTNYTDQERRAFRVHAFDYLVKPVEKEELFTVLADLERYRNKEEQKKVWIKTNGKMVAVALDDIMYFEYERRKARMVLRNDCILLEMPFLEVIEQFSYEEFVSPHRAFLINLKNVKEIQKYDILMENGEMVPIAQKRRAAFKKKFDHYLFIEAEKEEDKRT